MPEGHSSRLRDVWPFGKPKTPGFGLSKEFYTLVLTGRADLPTLLDLVNPEGSRGAVAGFGAPLEEDADKSALSRPIARGVYAVASPDRKTVLKMMVMPKEELAFDPEAFLASRIGSVVSADLRARIRATWMLMQFTFEAHDPTVAPSLDFLLDILERAGQLTEGVVADPMALRYLDPSELRKNELPRGMIDARDFVSVHTQEEPEGVRADTFGMAKFALPEFELRGASVALLEGAIALLTAVCQTVLSGKPVRAGASVGDPRAMFSIVASPGLPGAAPKLELIPERGKSVDDCLRAWLDSARP